MGRRGLSIFSRVASSPGGVERLHRRGRISSCHRMAAARIACLRQEAAPVPARRCKSGAPGTARAGRRSRKGAGCGWLGGRGREQPEGGPGSWGGRGHTERSGRNRGCGGAAVPRDRGYAEIAARQGFACGGRLNSGGCAPIHPSLTQIQLGSTPACSILAFGSFAVRASPFDPRAAPAPPPPRAVWHTLVLDRKFAPHLGTCTA